MIMIKKMIDRRQCIMTGENDDGIGAEIRQCYVIQRDMYHEHRQEREQSMMSVTRQHHDDAT